MSHSNTKYEAPPPIIFETVYTLKGVEKEKAVNLNAAALFGKKIFTALGNLTADDGNGLPPAIKNVYRQWSREGNCFRRSFPLPANVGGTWEISVDTELESMTLKVSPGTFETTDASKASSYERHCIEVIPDMVENAIFDLQALGNTVILEQFAHEEYGCNLQKTEWLEASISHEEHYIEANQVLLLGTA